jgi:hypothetical protein
MASGASNTPGAARPKKLLWMIPAVGVAVIVVSVVVILQIVGPAKGIAKTMSDGSDGSADDPALQTIGMEGLKYRDLKEGSGLTVNRGDTVTVNYTGWLAINGEEFDSSKKHGGQPATFSLDRVVRGWGEGIPGMRVGGIRKLVIPSELGYGKQGQPPSIPPDSTLIFEVEVLDARPGGFDPRGGLPPGHP